MNPEALHCYLTACRFSEDAVQATVLRYLIERTQVRHPRSWGFVAARNHEISEARHYAVRTKTQNRMALVQTPIYRNPEQLAETRQALSRAVQRPVKKNLAWQEDYQALLSEY